MEHVLHADNPSEIVHFELLFMGESDSGEAYILIRKDDASGFVCLELCTAVDSEMAVQTLMKWFSLVAIVLMWIFDRGLHFENKVMDALNLCSHAHHHFKTPYCPQSDSTGEMACEEVLRVCRALLSEFRLKESAWLAVHPLVQSLLNHSLRSGLGNRAPIVVFTGLVADNPLRSLVHSSSTAPVSIEAIKAKRIIKTDSLIKALDEMHRETRLRRTKAREAAFTRHNEKTHAQPVKFGVGDYFLVVQKTGKRCHKLLVTWRGPQRITRVMSDFIFECQDLISNSVSLVHANRLKFYSDA